MSKLTQRGLRVDHLLEVSDLRVHFFTDRGVNKVLDGVDLWIRENETLGLVGESGCGKTLTARAIMRLIPYSGRIVGGEILLEGENLLRLSEKAMRRVRGDRISMVFQEPMTSLNPLFSIGNQITEVLSVHRPSLNRREKKDRAIEILKQVGIPSPETRYHELPGRLSGGMRQRVVIAMALACGSPRLLIADEPTTALDVTIQAQILDLFKGLQEELGMALLLITHDLGVVAETADRVAVMYAGKVVEYSAVGELFNNPRHPYTSGLLASLPRPDSGEGRGRLCSIPGAVSVNMQRRRGCNFSDRCRYQKDGSCRGEEPDLREIEPGHWVRCSREEEADFRGDMA